MSHQRGPIFIGGLAYCGKTQLRIVLGAHPELSITRRTRLWDRYYDRFGLLSLDRNLDRLLAAMTADPGVRQLHPDLAAIRRAFRTGPSTYARLFELIHEQHAARSGARRWGDQLGFVERFADQIFAAIPDARMVHMVRDPRARLAADRAPAAVRPGALGWATAQWISSASLAQRNRRLYADRYCVVRYEALVRSRRETVARICAFLSERVTPSMERALEQVELPRTAASAQSPEEAALLHRYARAQLRQLGYPDQPPPSSALDRLAFWLAEWPFDRAAMALASATAFPCPVQQEV